MISFTSDYIAGAHPAILQALVDSNLEVLGGYGSDKYCDSTKAKIAEACQLPNAQVELITGGTQTNQLIIDSMLKPFEGVVAATTGHVACHEAGAIEYTGHKVLTVPGKDGKVIISAFEEYLETFYGDENHEHMVFPGMLYISHPTEYGTLYTKAELEQLAAICHKYDMRLYLDGARLAYGLMSSNTDVTLPDLARICDVFYIGGTKCGALCGEAVVFTKNNRPAHFVNFVKKHGALLAKGRVLGVQFDALFTDGLYYQIGKHGISMAERVVKLLTSKGYQMFLDSPTNQQFVVLENTKLAELSQEVQLGFWEKYDDTHTVMRFATSWSTTEEDMKKLEELL